MRCWWRSHCLGIKDRIQNEENWDSKSKYSSFKKLPEEERRKTLFKWEFLACCIYFLPSAMKFKGRDVTGILNFPSRKDRKDHFSCFCCLVAQLCPTRDSMHCSSSGSSVLGISQSRMLEWVVISSSRGSSWPTEIPPYTYHLDLTFVNILLSVGDYYFLVHVF